MRKCACHGLPRAANRQCVVKRRQAQARYESTTGGRVTRRRYDLRLQRESVLERLEELQAEKGELLG